MPVFVESEIDWLDVIRERIDSVFLDQLTHRARFCELRRDVGGKRGKPVGIWGWNTWCGIHDMTPLAWSQVHEVMKNTVDEGLCRTERGTGLLPHAIPIDEDGSIGYRNGEEETYYRTYSGIHGEDYCVDNIICWAKMALELFLYTRDRSWFTTEKLGIVEKSTDFILDNLRSDFNPDLIESGIEGDWTENTDWRGDNSNNNVSMIQCLDQLIEVERAFGRVGRARDYLEKASDMRSAFRADSESGGFWHEASGYFLHGNDGTGGVIYGDEYFESTANYYSLLLEIPDGRQRSRIFSYIDSNPRIESPLPVLTNYLPRNAARRMNYGQTVTDGDVWMTLGAHATAARLRWGYRREATSMYRAIFDYEREHGTIDNAIYMDGTADEKWSPEIGNYGSIFTTLVEGVLGLRPTSEGLLIRPMPLEGMSKLKILEPLTYGGKRFLLEISWRGGTVPETAVDGKKLVPTDGGILLDPEYEDGCKIEMVYR